MKDIPNRNTFKMEQEDNHIVKWFKSNQGLVDIIDAIDAQKLTREESAKLAFYQVSGFFGFAKTAGRYF